MTTLATCTSTATHTLRNARQCPVFRISAEESNKFVLLASPQQDAVGFVQVIEIFDKNGATPPNQHRAADELFVVLSGQGVAVTDAGELALKPGLTLLVRPGCMHAVRNTGEGRLYCLTTMVPNEDFAELITRGVADALDAQDLEALGWT